MTMERSGHLSVTGVQSYECTTSLQQKEVSDSLSRKTNGTEEWKPLKELLLNKSASGSCSPYEEEKDTTETNTTQIPDDEVLQL